MTQPGLLWVSSKVSRPDLLSEEDFKSWYEDQHIQKDIFSSSGISTAFRYKNIDPNGERLWLAIYPVKDADWLLSKEFMQIPITDKVFKTEGNKCFDCVDFDTRFYEFLHGFEAEGAKSGPASLIISAALTPADGADEEFDRWYKEEHYRTLTECKGYIRTRRYKLKTAVTKTGIPKYLALHEFEGEALPAEGLDKSANTEWAKKMMGGLVGQEILVFRHIGSWGDVEAKF